MHYTKVTKIVNRRREPHECAPPLRAIVNFCRECVGFDGGAAAVEACTAPECWLFPYRMGKNPLTSASASATRSRLARERSQALHGARKSSKRATPDASRDPGVQRDGAEYDVFEA